jgi:hypothetical protein
MPIYIFHWERGRWICGAASRRCKLAGMTGRLRWRYSRRTRGTSPIVAIYYVARGTSVQRPSSPLGICFRSEALCIKSRPFRALLLVVVVVLLKAGKLEAVSSESRDVFSLARARDAGICGIFDDRANAEAYIEELRKEQKRNRWGSQGHAYVRQTPNR